MIDALKRLSARQRAAVFLRYVEGLSESEIANALSCRPGTVKSLLARARTQLERDLAP
jgi:RNA polymerase sigma factor (sigma-70 family)